MFVVWLSHVTFLNQIKKKVSTSKPQRANKIMTDSLGLVHLSVRLLDCVLHLHFLGDPGAVCWDEGKSKLLGKNQGRKSWREGEKLSLLSL